MSLLEVCNLSITLRTKTGLIPIVSSLSFKLDRGSCLTLVGESGSGKSMVIRAVAGLLDPMIYHVQADILKFNGQNLLGLSVRQRRKICGAGMAMIFQDPLFSLHPLKRIGDQITEAFLMHQPHLSANRAQELQRLLSLVQLDGIVSPQAYPHELSGGQRQRIVIAIALALKPQIILADEPTTALDVSVQKQILQTLKSLQKDLGLSIIFVSHDLGLVSYMGQETLVLYAGRCCEKIPTQDFMSKAQHPYSLALLSSRPDQTPVGQDLPFITGQVPPLNQRPAHQCLFADRCAQSSSLCHKQTPPMMKFSTQEVYCHHVRS